MNTRKTWDERTALIEKRTELQQLQRMNRKISHQRRLEREIQAIERGVTMRGLFEIVD